MNIICGTLSKFDVFLHVTETFQRMGHSVKFFPTESYREVRSYPEKKLYKLGFHQRRDRYLCAWLENLYKTAEVFHPDVVLFINGPRDILSAEDMIHIKKRLVYQLYAGSLTVLLGEEGRKHSIHIMTVFMFLKNRISST